MGSIDIKLAYRANRSISLQHYWEVLGIKTIANSYFIKYKTMPRLPISFDIGSYILGHGGTILDLVYSAIKQYFQYNIGTKLLQYQYQQQFYITFHISISHMFNIWFELSEADMLDGEYGSASRHLERLQEQISWEVWRYRYQLAFQCLLQPVTRIALAGGQDPARQQYRNLLRTGLTLCQLRPSTFWCYEPELRLLAY
uniref:Uncharacterized protein n=1 Tax=Spironucleus salmonicida TaxID=348837 RepID=V6LQY6_9EUKA|eukprot:EST43159.1 Hypothetical protein SS50377_17191 [Spironucleus salmonicida]